MNKINYNIEFNKTVNSLNGEKKTLLLHACCAPCASACLLRVMEAFEVTVFYYNPNITSTDEYNMRVDELHRLCDIFNEKYGAGIKTLDGRYDTAEFYSIAKGYEDIPEKGIRCHRCYDMRIKETARVANEINADFFATTLTLSPMKDEQVLNRIGFENAALHENGALWLPSDFKKEGGYAKSIELSKEYGLYRQNFCGCEYSRR